MIYQKNRVAPVQQQSDPNREALTMTPNYIKSESPEQQYLQQAASFLNILDDSQETFTFETIVEPKPTKGKACCRRYHGTLTAQGAQLLQANREHSGVFFAVNETDGKGRKSDNIVRVRALFVDLDGSPLEPVLKGPLNPHIVVESSPGRYHVYWIVDEVPLEHFEGAQRRLSQQFGSDPTVCDLPRLMRLPGFLHRKSEPFRSRVIETSGALPYIFKDFCRAFGWDLEAARENGESLRPLMSAKREVETATLSKLREVGLVKSLESDDEGRWLIRCPWAKEHSSGEDAYYFAKPSEKYPGEGFNCFHAHCKHRDIRSLRFFLGLPPIEGTDPLPLFREVLPPTPFPAEALGPILHAAAKEIHATIKSPLAVIAQSLLGAASLVSQAHANIGIDGRTIALSLFLITIAESGERKSAVDDVVLAAVLQWQKSCWGVYREELRIYEAKLEELKNTKKRAQLIGETTNAVSEPEPDVPIMPIIVVEEPTYEGLVKYLEHGEPSVGLFSDEGGRFLGGNAMSRDNLLKTLAGFSSLWDAKPGKPITRIRSGDKSLALYGRRVALHLMIQESVYSQLNEQSLCESQGFLPRCLIAFPKSLAGSRSYVSANVLNSSAIQRFYDHCNGLLDKRQPTSKPPAPKNQLEPPSITLSSDAYQRWVQFHDSVEEKLGSGGLYHPIRRFGSKAAEHALRIAGVMTIFENPSATEITKEHVERAVTLIEYYLGERLRLENYCAIDPLLLTAQQVLDYAASKDMSGVLLRDLYQYGPPAVRSKNKAITILKVLEDHCRAFPVPAHEIRAGARGKAWRLIWPTN